MVRKVEAFEDRNGGLHREEAVALMVEARADVKHAVEACTFNGHFALDDFLERVKHDPDVKSGLLKLISETDERIAAYVLIDTRTPTTMVEAIKLVRCMSGMKLKPAKDWVEAMASLVCAPAGWCGPVPGVTNAKEATSRIQQTYGMDACNILRHEVEFRSTYAG